MTIGIEVFLRKVRRDEAGDASCVVGGGWHAFPFDERQLAGGCVGVGWHAFPLVCPNCRGVEIVRKEKTK